MKMKHLEKVEITKNTFPVQSFQLFNFSFFFCRSQEDSKSRFSKTKSLRDKFRESKTWSLRRSVEKESSPVQTTSNHSSNQCDKNGNNDHHSSTTSLSSSKCSALEEENAGRQIARASADILFTFSGSSTYAGQLSRLFSLRRSLGPGSFEPPKGK